VKTIDNTSTNTWQKSTADTAVEKYCQCQ